MSKNKVREYSENQGAGLDGTENHCGNCANLGMCLGLEFTQPFSAPQPASPVCSFFEWNPRCKKCGLRKELVGKDTFWKWRCPNKCRVDKEE